VSGYPLTFRYMPECEGSVIELDIKTPKAETPETIPSPPSTTVRRHRSGLFVLLLSVLAGALYAWGLSRGAPHYYYSAAVRSMSESWHDLFFGAFDQSGSITTDKLPGSLWVHAVFVRVLGMHTWVLLLPEVLAATGAVPLLFGAVRRWAGTRAAFTAAVVFVFTPAVFAVAQVNIPDTLMTFCVVAAAYALVRSLDESGIRWLLLSAVLVGAGFQMKMLQALLVLPAFCLAYLVCANRTPKVRLVRTVAYGALSLLVSVSWMIVVSLIPAADRPRIDGSSSNSLWDMVFVYNGISRSGSGQTGGTGSMFGGPPGPFRLFDDQVAAQISWLLPLAALLLVAALIRIRRLGRRELGGWLLWGTWLVLAWAACSELSGMHPYYTALVAPALAAVVGAGLDHALTAWRERRPVGLLLPVGVLLSAVWAFFVVLRTPVGLNWLVPVIAVAALVSLALLAILRSGKDGVLLGVTALATGVTLLAAPLAWILSTPVIPDQSTRVVDPVAGPPEAQAQQQKLSGGGALPALDPQLLSYLQAHRGTERFLFASGESSTSAPYLSAGQNVLPLRGFSTASPSVPVSELSRLVATGELRYVLMINLPGMAGPAKERADWVGTHCATIDRTVYEAQGKPSPWAPVLHDCHP
jgi:4-amino-4-deoxy-L-arabinose transferase-like glycosyltransferase